MATEPNNQGRLNDYDNSEHIQTSGGASIRGSVTNQGGVNQFGGTMGNVTYTDNRSLSPSDEAKLKELFTSLYQEIDVVPNVASEDKAKAKDAAQALQEEVDAVKQDPKHKPDRWKMSGLISAFKNVGAPVLNIALTILGFPPLGAAINAFAQALPDNKK
jgi:hypothetical protein